MKTSPIPGQSFSWTTFLQPFSLHFWFCLQLYTLLCTILLYFVNHFHYNVVDPKWSIRECFSLICKSLISISMTSMPKRLSTRILFLAILLVGTVLWASYQVKIMVLMLNIVPKKLLKIRFKIVQNFHFAKLHEIYMEHKCKHKV